MNFSNILLVLDTRLPGQAMTLRRVATFAQHEGACLTVCALVDRELPEISRHISAGTVRKLNDSIRTRKLERLKQLVATNGVSGSNIAVKVLIGKAQVEVAELVRENQHDLVVKPTVNRPAIPLSASVREDRELVRSCPCTVWLCNIAEQEQKGCVLAALDVTPDGASKAGLNQHIVETSRSIALAESRPLHFVHAWYLRGESHMRAQHTPATDLEADRMHAWELAKRKSRLQNLVARPPSGSRCSESEEYAPRLHVLQGPAKKVIPDLAEQLGAGLIVMGSAVRTDQELSGFIHRKTAEILLPRIATSMLFVKQPESSPLYASEERHSLRPVR